MDVIMPQLGETVAEGTVTRWYKKVGDAVKADETLFDVETDKVSTEIPAPAGGVLAEILVREGVTAKVGTRIAVIRESGAAAVTTSSGSSEAVAVKGTSASPETRAARSVPRAGAAERLSPVVRKLCAEHALDPQQIPGTGRDGRITREDVLEYIATRGAAPASPTFSPDRVPAQATTDAARSTISLNNVRRRTAEHMARSWTTVPHVLQAVEADFHRIVAARRRMGEQWKQREGFALTYLPFIARAVSIALARFPHLNATFDGAQLALHRRVNLGIAVDLNFEGLVVPVVKDVPNKSLPQIAREINDLAARARAGRLKPDELTEATYTITNNGAFGTLFTAPIINAPQVAILSTDAIRKKPVVIEAAEGDSIAIRPLGMLAQSFDHRAVDGAYAAAFLQEVKSAIETRDWLQALQA
ncbi:MAG TPA: dihydrolipoamide acetyltransferase family protein [Burkholderiales bacterium]|jgi:2-oxoglutarate dehydrogenase E2 component (dihydrolipoamide succinyltransferase)|nr:dihydrolipoamide acetyltransferase family protein [Burkholderiales bacterium]